MAKIDNPPIESERYKILSLIDKGSNGSVYTAEDNLTGKIVAIKVHTPTELAKEQMVKRNLDPFKAMMKEGDSLVAARHVLPRIVALDNNNIPYIVMPYCRRGTLEHILGKSSVNSGYPEKQVAFDYMLDIATGLDELHTVYGRVHGDLKPDNIMVDDNRRLVLNDLGTSTCASLGWSSSPRDNMGFIHTRAPELFKEDSHPDRYSDSYAACAIYYKIFTGEYPLEDELNNAIDPGKLLDDIGEKRLRQIIKSKVKKNIPKGFRTLIAKGLDPHPWNRYAEGTILKREVEGAIKEQSFSYQTKKKLRNLTAGILAPVFVAAVLLGRDLTAPFFDKKYEDLPAKPQLNGPLYLPKSPEEKPIAFETEDISSLPYSAEGMMIDNKAYDRIAAKVTDDKTTAFLTGNYIRALWASGSISNSINDYQYGIWLHSGHPDLKLLPIDSRNIDLFEYKAAAKNIEYAIHEARKVNGNIDLEDMCVIARVGREVLKNAKEASKGFDFNTYITAKNPEGKYIISEDDQTFIKYWLAHIQDKHRPYP